MNMKNMLLTLVVFGATLFAGCVVPPARNAAAQKTAPTAEMAPRAARAPAERHRHDLGVHMRQK